MSSDTVANTATATEQVLNTAQLLEHILSSFQPLEILVASKVSRRWESIIEGSLALRHGLFLQYRDDKSYRAAPVSPGHRIPRYQGQDESIQSWASVPVYMNPIEVNPLFRIWDPMAWLFPYELLILSYEPHYTDIVYSDFTRSYVRHRFGGLSKSDHTEASWHSLYFTSPPITDIVIRLQTDLASHNKFHQVNLHAKTGITLGLICDNLERELSQISITNSRGGPSLENVKHPTGDDFVMHWGKEDHPMFLVKAPKDTIDSDLQ